MPRMRDREVPYGMKGGEYSMAAKKGGAKKGGAKKGGAKGGKKTAKKK